MQFRQQLGRGLVAFGHGLAVRSQETCRAEVLGEQEAVVQILRQNRRDREPCRKQQPVDRHERRDRSRRVRDLGIGLAVADRRAEHQRRRIHQDDRLGSIEAHRLVGSRRGVAGQMRAVGAQPARAIEEIADRKRARDPCHRRLGPGNLRQAAVVEMVELDMDGIVRQSIAGSVGPFDQHHAAGDRLAETQFVEFRGRAKPVEVEMGDRQPRLVDLHQREGRARHFEIGLIGHRPHQGARQRRLAGAEIALQSDDIAGAQHRGDILAKQRGCVLVRQDARESQSRRRATPPRRARRPASTESGR